MAKIKLLLCMLLRHVGEWKYSPTHSSWHWMQMSGQVHVLAALPLRKVHLVFDILRTVHHDIFL